MVWKLFVIICSCVDWLFFVLALLISPTKLVYTLVSVWYISVCTLTPFPFHCCFIYMPPSKAMSVWYICLHTDPISFSLLLYIHASIQSNECVIYLSAHWPHFLFTVTLYTCLHPKQWVCDISACTLTPFPFHCCFIYMPPSKAMSVWYICLHTDPISFSLLLYIHASIQSNECVIYLSAHWPHFLFTVTLYTCLHPKQWVCHISVCTLTPFPFHCYFIYMPPSKAMSVWYICLHTDPISFSLLLYIHASIQSNGCVIYLSAHWPHFLFTVTLYTCLHPKQWVCDISVCTLTPFPFHCYLIYMPPSKDMWLLQWKWNGFL